MSKAYPPATHTSDPTTSHDAEREHTRSGARGRHCRIVLDLVERFPMETASELELLAPFDLQEVRRRLTDLKHAGYVVQDLPRLADGRRKAETTWRVLELGDLLE